MKKIALLFVVVTNLNVLSKIIIKNLRLVAHNIFSPHIQIFYFYD